jgi:hypothetical protein
VGFDPCPFNISLFGTNAPDVQNNPEDVNAGFKELSGNSSPERCISTNRIREMRLFTNHILADITQVYSMDPFSSFNATMEVSYWNDAERVPELELEPMEALQLNWG